MQQEIDNLKLRQDHIETQVGQLTGGMEKVVTGIDKLVPSFGELTKQFAVFATKYEHQEKINDEMKRSIERMGRRIEKEESLRREVTEEVIENRRTMKLMDNISQKLTFVGFALIVLVGGFFYKSFGG